MDETLADCTLCRVAAGDQTPPSGWMIRNDLVSAYISEGNKEVAGWCQLQVNRHAATLADLTAAETAAIGAASQALAAAAIAATGVADQKIYMYSMCEFVPHFHLVIGPAPVTPPDEPRGAPLLSRLLARAEQLRNAAYADSIAEKMRATLAAER